MASRVSTLTVRLIDDVTRPARSVAQALKDAERAAKDVAKGMAGTGATPRLVSDLQKIKATRADIATVADAWNAYRKSAGLAGDATKWTRAQVADVRSWERQTVGELRAVKREQEAFNRGVARAAANAPSTRPRLGPMLAGLGAGYQATRAGGAAWKQGSEVGHERARMHASGMSPAEIEEAQTRAFELSKQVRLVNVGEAMHTIRNIRSVVGDMHEALEVAGPIMKMRATVQATHPHAAVAEDFDQLIKGMEIKGVTQDMGKFNHYIEGMTKALNVFGDTLKPFQYYEMFKYGRQATSRLSDDFMLSIAPTLAQELGGSSTGNALSGFNSTIVGGRMKNVAMQAFNELGLVDMSKVIKTKTDSIKGIKPGGMKETGLAATNPYEWVQKVLRPAMEAKGMTPEQMNDMLPRLFGDRVVSQLVGILLNQQGRIEKDKRMVDGAKGTDALDNYLKNDPQAGLKALQESTNTLLSTLTSPLMPAASQGMSMLASGITSLTGVLQNNPGVAELTALTAGVAGLGAAAGGAKLVKDVLTGGGASVALNGSAAALNVSAEALTAAAARLGAPGVPGPLTGPGGAAPGAATGAAAGGVLARMLSGLPTLAGVAATGAALGAGINYMGGNILDIGLTPEQATEKGRKRRSLEYSHNPGGSSREQDDRLKKLLRGDGGSTTPKVDTSALDGFVTKADDAKGKLDGLNATVKPNVDSSSVQEAKQEFVELEALMKRVGSMIASVGARAQKAAADVRRSYADIGISE
jgi:hypothetical protein